MAFGQSTGPPATGKQVKELLELLEAAGHTDFRDARGPMGFNQRQAGGRFSRDEADAFIEQLQSEIYGDGPPTDSTSSASAPVTSNKTAPRNAAKGGSKVAGRSPAKASLPAKGSWRSNLPNAEGDTPKTKAKQENAPASVKTKTNTSTRTKTKRKTKDVPSKAEPVPAELQDVPDALLAAELQRRGWTVVEP